MPVVFRVYVREPVSVRSFSTPVEGLKVVERVLGTGEAADCG